MPTPPIRSPDAALTPKPVLDQRQQLIHRQRQRCGGEAAEQHEHPVLGLQPREDVVAEAGLADRRRERRGADHPHSGGADACHDDRQRQRQLHREQGLPRCHADALRRFDQRAVDAVQPGDGVAQHRQHRIERERQHGRQKAESGEAEAEPAERQRRQREQQRIEQGEQCEPGHGLHDAREPQQHAARERPVARGDRQRQADHEPQRERGDTDPHVVAEIVGKMPQRLAPARIGQDAHAALSRGSSAPSRSACRRGVRSSSIT